MIFFNLVIACKLSFYGYFNVIACHVFIALKQFQMSIIQEDDISDDELDLPTCKSHTLLEEDISKTKFLGETGSVYSAPPLFTQTTQEPQVIDISTAVNPE